MRDVMPGAEFVESHEPLVPRRAVVVARARRAGSTACLPIDQLIAPILRSHRSGVAYLVAPAGAGKTTALCHLRAVLPQELKVGLFDEPRYGHWREAAREVPVVVATRTAPA